MLTFTPTLTTPQIARLRARIGERAEASAEVVVTPVGLLAIGGLVAAILLSIPPIVRAARSRPARVPSPGLPTADQRIVGRSD